MKYLGLVAFAIVGALLCPVSAFADQCNGPLPLLQTLWDSSARDLQNAFDAENRKDFSEAMSWYLKAADLGNARAQFNIGVLYEQGWGTKEDYAKAMSWYRKAADQGYGCAQFNVGGLYRQGLGVKQDYAEAMRWFRKAADHGNALGQLSIGLLYINGLSVEKDYAEGLRWLRMAADQGDVRAQFYIGVLYLNGWGVRQDEDQARVWMTKAAAGDSEEAKNWLTAHPAGAPPLRPGTVVPGPSEARQVAPAPQPAAPPDVSAPDACFVLSGEERRTVSCAVDLGPGHPATLSHTKISKTECFVFHGGEITCSEMDAAEVASGLTSKNLNLDAKWETKVSKTSCNAFSPADHMTITCASLDSTEANLIKMGYCYNPSIPGDGLVQDWHKCLPNEHQAASAPQPAWQQQADRIRASRDDPSRRLDQRVADKRQVSAPDTIMNSEIIILNIATNIINTISAMIELTGLIGLLILLVLYFLPFAVAIFGHHRNKGAIFILNLFLGWTLVGWVVAVMWAVLSDQKVRS